MTVYAKKGKKGTTGLWVVEVTVNGTRYRETTRDNAEALRREAELRAGCGLPVP